MRKRVIAVAVAALIGGFAGGIGYTTISGITSSDPGNLAPTAAKIADEFLMSRAGASAPQITQLGSEANVAYQVALIRQNDEIIRLLRKLAGE